MTTSVVVCGPDLTRPPSKDNPWYIGAGEECEVQHLAGTEFDERATEAAGHFVTRRNLRLDEWSCAMTGYGHMTRITGCDQTVAETVAFLLAKVKAVKHDGNDTD